MRTVAETMGTTLSLVVEGVGDGEHADLVDNVRAVFAAMDGRFSLYDPTSELSRVAVGQLTLGETSFALRALYAEALEWRSATGGAFTPHRPDGVIDLDGIVKAAAIRGAAAVMRTAEATSWCLNVGGDVMVHGRRADGSPWILGIVDPADRSSLLCSVTLSPTRCAAATSGSAERGDHIWSTLDSDDAFEQVTVVSGDIVLSDILATAIVSGGRTTLDTVTARWDIDVLTVDSAGELTATPGIRAALAD